jgi:hypothetical protein
MLNISFKAPKPFMGVEIFKIIEKWFASMKKKVVIIMGIHWY